jgi:hypothetical protein
MPLSRAAITQLCRGGKLDSLAVFFSHGQTVEYHGPGEKIAGSSENALGYRPIEGPLGIQSDFYQLHAKQWHRCLFREVACEIDLATNVALSIV